MRKDAFSGYHPVVNLLYFLLVIGVTMCLFHPVGLCISFCSAVGYSAYLKGGKLGQLRFLLPMMLMAAVCSPLFQHHGDTILLILPTGSPLTLESLLYGFAAAVMLGAVTLWFSCWTAVMTSDKLVYLLGRLAPSLSLLLVMILGMVPRFGRQFCAVYQAQQYLSWELSNKRQRIKQATAVCSAMLTWSMEQAVETADSMKSRGFGLPGRSTFFPCRLDKRDKQMLLWLTVCGGCFLLAGCTGGLHWQYFPTIQGTWSLYAWLAYLALCLTPLGAGLYEARLWQRKGGRLWNRCWKSGN